MPSERYQINPIDLSADESVALDRIRRGDLVTWIFGTPCPNFADHFSGVCLTLNSLQRRGLIAGFRTHRFNGTELPLIADLVLC